MRGDHFSLANRGIKMGKNNQNKNKNVCERYGGTLDVTEKQDRGNKWRNLLTQETFQDKHGGIKTLLQKMKTVLDGMQINSDLEKNVFLPIRSGIVSAHNVLRNLEMGI